MDLLTHPLPAPLAAMNLGLAWEALRLHPWATLLPLLVQAALTLAVLRAATAQGRAPNLGGWLLGPAAGAMTGALLFALCGLDRFGAPALCALGVRSHPYVHLEPHLVYALAHLALALGAAGLQLGLSGLTQRARQAGLSGLLSLSGAGLLALAGVAEAHRLQLGAWFMSAFAGASLWPQVEDGYLLKVWLLRYAMLIGVLLSLAVWRHRGEAAPSLAEGLRAALLTLGVLATLVLAWVVLDLTHQDPRARTVDLWAAPETLARPADAPPYAEAPFPHRYTPLSVLEAGLLGPRGAP